MTTYELTVWLRERHDEVRKRTVSPETTAICGTLSGYQTHRRLGIPICDLCRKARADYAREWRKKHPGYYSSGKVRTRKLKRQPERKWRGYDLTIDHLTIDGGWLTADGIGLAINRDPDTVERHLRKLRSEGLVESRLVELSALDGNKYREARTEWKAC